ncbi:unnamed protein product, partial [marine sediment metagenome]
GGYTLAKPPSKITLKEIIAALEGSLDLSECIKTPQVCNRASFCVTRELWDEISEKMINTLDSKTLQDLVNKHKNKIKSQPLMYNI